MASFMGQSINKEETKGGYSGQEKKTEKEELSLRESLFSDDFWSKHRRTRIYRSTKII